jgi:fibronectin type 3 domain-containing protein
VRQRSRIAAAWGLGLAVAAGGCRSTLDLERARLLFQGAGVPPVPPLAESPPADLPAPGGVRARSGELRAVAVQWEPLLVGDVGGYVVERSSAREGPYERLAGLPGRLSTLHVDANAVPGPRKAGDGEAEPLDGATFFYRVRAFTPRGALSGEASPVVAATTAPPPAPPEGVRAYSYQPRQVPLSWRAPEDSTVTGYVVERSPTSVGPFEPIAQLPERHTTAYVDSGLGDLRVFYYRVAARNGAGGVGEPSDPVRAVTKPEPLPPVGVRVVQQWLGANRLAWEPNVEADIATFRVLRKRSAGSGPEVVGEVTGGATRLDDRALGASEKVIYSVVAIDRDGLESDPSNAVVVESEGYGLSATARPDGVHLAWRERPEEGFARARVYRVGALGQRELASVTGGSFLDTDVKPGGRYRYFVVLQRPDGTAGPASEPVELTLPGR